MPKHLPFNSKYLQDFEVVEQREGNIGRFPHTEQLPKLLRALNLEFRAGLPDKIARVDHRAKDYMKIQRHQAVLMFCSFINRARQDNLRLRALLDRNLVARISIVQQVIERQERGLLHRFKFYGGDDLFTETYLNGRRIVFAGHVIDRFSERVPNHAGTDLTNFLLLFFGSPAILMECNNSPAFVYSYDESVMAFPIRESDTEKEYFFSTCLTGEVINRLQPLLPPVAYTHTYDAAYQMPAIRNWNPIGWQLGLCELWKRKHDQGPALVRPRAHKFGPVGVFMITPDKNNAGNR